MGTFGAAAGSAAMLPRGPVGVSPAGRPALDVDVAASTGDVVMLRARGVLDLTTAPTLRAGLDRCLDGASRGVVLDLSGVVFCDVRGLTALLHGYTHAARRGVAVAIAGAPPLLVRMWNTFRPADRGVHHPTVGTALREVTHGRGTGRPAAPYVPTLGCRGSAP